MYLLLNETPARFGFNFNFEKTKQCFFNFKLDKMFAWSVHKKHILKKTLIDVGGEFDYRMRWYSLFELYRQKKCRQDWEYAVIWHWLLCIHIVQLYYFIFIFSDWSYDLLLWKFWLKWTADLACAVNLYKKKVFLSLLFFLARSAAYSNLTHRNDDELVTKCGCLIVTWLERRSTVKEEEGERDKDESNGAHLLEACRRWAWDLLCGIG